MKMKTTIVFFLSMAIAISSFGQTTLKFAFNFKFNGEPFKLNQTYDDLSGTKVNLTRAQFYLSMDKAIHDGGNETDLSGNFILADYGIESYLIDSNLSITDLEEIHFGFGVHPDVNHNDPTTYSAEHPLALKSPTMHWGWTSGYKFFALEGNIDSDNDQTPDKLFQMHAVGDEFYKSMKLVANKSVANNEIVVEVIVDLGTWFTNVDLQDVGILHGGGPVMEAAVANTPQVFNATTIVNVKDNAYQIVENTINILNQLNKTMLTYELAQKLEGQLKIIDLNGSLVESINIQNQIGAIDISHLSNGVYLYSVENLGTSVLSSKFVIY
jgi:hypothetical protein